MCSLFKSSQQRVKSAGFTLLELLIVISLLAVLAGFSISAYDGVKDDANYDAAIYEMAEIRNALLQFRRDSGTNSFPGQGTYDCTDATNGGSSTDINSNFTLPTEAGSTDAERIAWCQHPANFWMLFQDPIGDGWNRDTKRGWNGPYLRRKSGYVDVGDNIDSDGSGDPSSGTVISDLWGIASPFILDPNGNYLVWRNQIAGGEVDNIGTPYLLFDLDDNGLDPTTLDPARLVSLGIGHAYDGDNNSDCLQDIADDGYPLDHVLCLLR